MIWGFAVTISGNVPSTWPPPSTLNYLFGLLNFCLLGWLLSHPFVSLSPRSFLTFIFSPRLRAQVGNRLIREVSWKGKLEFLLRAILECPPRPPIPSVQQVSTIEAYVIVCTWRNNLISSSSTKTFSRAGRTASCVGGCVGTRCAGAAVSWAVFVCSARSEGCSSSSSWKYTLNKTSRREEDLQVSCLAPLALWRVGKN